MEQSFAFQGPAPVQAAVTRGGGSSRAQIVGGRTQGGAVTAGPQTDAPATAGALGQYFEQLMQPYVERQQRARFFEGFQAAASGTALNELADSHSPITQLFGPTGFEAGAEFYAAQQSLDEYSSTVIGDMDNLVKMDPRAAAARLAEHSQRMMTGNPFADQIIQQGLIERAGPLMQTIARGRYTYQQQEAVRTMSSARDAAATQFQQLVTANNNTATPGEPERLAMQQAMANYVSGAQRPEGMSDDSYRGFLRDDARRQMQHGNWYAVEAMRRAGAWEQLSGEDQAALENDYQRYGQRAIQRAAMNRADDIIALDTDIAMERETPMGAARRAQAINEAIRSDTGVDLDLWDYREITNRAGSVVSAIVAGSRRAEERQYQREVRDEARAYDRAERQREDAETAARAQALWGTGNVNSGIAAGMHGEDFDVLAIQDYRQGNMARIANAFAREGWVSARARSIMQARVTASMGEGYSNDFQRAYQEWQAMNTANHGAAAAYYGEWHAKFQAFDTAIRGHTSPQVAYRNTFGDPGRFAVAAIPADRRREANTAIDLALAAQDSFTVFGMQPFGTTNLNDSGKQVMRNALTDSVARAIGQSDTPTAAIVQQQMQVLISSGRVERVGADAWRNPERTRPLSTVIGVQPRELEGTWTDTVNARLQAAGVAGRPYSVIRLPDQGNEAHIVLEVHKDDGTSVPIHITGSQLRQRAGERVREQRAPSRDPDSPARRRAQLM